MLASHPVSKGLNVEQFNWTCPFCNHAAVITQANSHEFGTRFKHGNKHGYQQFSGTVVVCPNADCSEYALAVATYDLKTDKAGNIVDRVQRQTWTLVPNSMARVFPSYIPASLREDYTEACLILDKSPKASATLARRCLQGMIRDFWGVTGKRTLADEIEAIQNSVEPDTWDAIDALRKLGNIGAHMERDINLIVEVDQDEAELLIQLIETLFEDWYVRRHERQQRMAKIKATAAEKDAQRKSAGKAGSGD